MALNTAFSASQPARPRDNGSSELVGHFSTMNCFSMTSKHRVSNFLVNLSIDSSRGADF